MRPTFPNAGLLDAHRGVDELLSTDQTCQDSITGIEPVCIEWYPGPPTAWGLWDTKAPNKPKKADCICVKRKE